MAPPPKPRAPSENDRALIAPGWAELLQRLAAPPPAPADSQLAGESATRLRADARRELVALAAAYTGRYASAPARPFTDETPLVLSGHQPELFHPGVWFKNIALDALAKQAGAVGVHLLIDTDLCQAPGVRTPTGSLQEPRVEPAPLDARGPSAPYEQRPIHDADLFDSFGERVASLVAPLVRDPLALSRWPLAIEARRRGATLGQALSEYRHRIELGWGSQTLELPLSAACDGQAFRCLAAELLARPAQTRAAYNAALAEFRQRRRLRNAAQPLPDLAEADGLVETPLWVWSDDTPARRALFASLRDGRLRLTDRHGWSADGPADAASIAAWIAELRQRGVKLRSRALVTTLFARLLLADLFLHGIGGARYDEVTDRFAELLLGVRLPWHATLSATLRLPIEHGLPGPTELRGLRQKRRDLRFHGEWFLPEGSPAADAASQKADWIAQAKTPANAAQRHAGITEANSRMHAALRPLREETDEAIAAARHGVRARRVLDSREHSFCLFPEADLRRRLAALCP
ncbi:hypothetical protein [Botrimarina sp.]|uniref:hypothetical protein n=1 Tax=Botrimarina sp. TaxID=2795802 RepID=UPI0032EE011A